MVSSELVKEINFIEIDEQKDYIPVKIKLPWGKQNIEEIRVENNQIIIIPRYD